MAYKWVDETKLNAALTASADAIREKTGDTTQINFDMENETGFESAIEEIPSGGATEPYIGVEFNSSGQITRLDYYGFDEIYKYAPSGGNRISRVEIHGNAKKLLDQAFQYVDYLTTITMPDTIETIGKQAFHSDWRLTLDHLPSSLTTLGEAAFYGCTNLNITSVPANVTTIPKNAFNLCTRLKSITFLGTPTSIDSTAFGGDDGITVINVPWAENEVANAPWGAANATIHYNYTPEV